MATLMKFHHVNLIRKCVIRNQLYAASRNITTSKKKPQNNCPQQNQCSPPEDEADCPPGPLPWVSYGFDYNDQKEDENLHHASFFFSVTLCLVFGSFMWAYAPDCHMRDWAQREAFLQIRSREKGGLPLISPHFVEPSKIQIPPEDKLCGIEIII